MKTIIAGSRTCSNKQSLISAIEACGWTPTVVISGGARGADQLGEAWAKENHIPCETYLAEWDKLGRSAGYIRNATMADKAEALIALWDGKSPGTAHMIRLANQRGLRVHVHIPVA